MKRKSPAPDLPSLPTSVARSYPELMRAYHELGDTCADAGPLDERSERLVKLALAIGIGSEGAVHSHARRGLGEGLEAEELEHVALLAIPTIGFPRAMAGLSWIRDVTRRRSSR
jgi:alkylhydroperoxidase/carboxymuconolactone decarboxylase family protein YurZ